MDIRESSLLPPDPPSLAVRHRNPHRHWTVRLPVGLAVENDPPVRRILLNERVIALYPVDDMAQERLALLHILQQDLLPATVLAEAWGIHRNSLNNWAWRHRFFGLDGLVDGRLPSRRDVLERILRESEAIVRETPRVSGTRLGQALQQRGLGVLPPSTLGWLRRVVFGVTPLKLDFASLDPEPGPVPEPPATESGTETSEQTTGDPAAAGTEQIPEASGIDSGIDDRAAEEGDDQDRDGTPPATGTGQPGPGSEQTGDPTAGCLEVASLVPLPPPAGTPGQAVQHAGLALVLPAMQQLLDPLDADVERALGAYSGYYRPRHLLEAFLLYLLANFRNPEQTKASPALDFGPLLGRRRAPACGTLRRRLPAMAAQTELTNWVQRQLALQYLRLGWVQLGFWLVDGHFSPFFGAANWAKGWWPQRRMPEHGYCQEWVHDRRGRPLWMHCTQAFELFADQLPLLAAAVADLLREVGETRPTVIVFDRGGYSSNVFTALNAQGTGWVTWLKSPTRLPAELFTEQAEIPGGEGRPGRTVYYARTTHRVEGCNDHVPAVYWHEGDPEQQLALLDNLDQREPGVWSPLQKIAMLTGRWAQENSFKAQTRDFDLDWTNGYSHEPCAETPVPNPQVREWTRRRGERANQLRRAMDRGIPRRPAAAARYRRRLGVIRGQLTRLDNQLRKTPATVPYRDLGRPATEQLHPGRGTLIPALRATAYHLRLQVRDVVARVFPDHRERDKVIRVLFDTPGQWLRTPEEDWVILRRPQLPRYAKAISHLVAWANARAPHAPGQPNRPLRFALAEEP